MVVGAVLVGAGLLARHASQPAAAKPAKPIVAKRSAQLRMSDEAKDSIRAAAIVLPEIEPDDDEEDAGEEANAAVEAESDAYDNKVIELEESLVTNGALLGRMRDPNNQEPLAGVTIVATSPSMEGTQTAISDEAGWFSLVLPPGDYHVIFYYLDTREDRDALVTRGEVSPVYQYISSSPPPPPPPPPPAPEGITIDPDYYRNIPVPGRTFESVLGAAAGSQDDGEGVSFSGGTTLENTYVIDEDVFREE